MRVASLAALSGLIAFGVVIEGPTVAHANGDCSAPGGTTYAGGTGLSTDPYLIANEAQLLLLSATVADHDKYFRQTADITLDMSSCTWPSIGQINTNEFRGVYDGQNHSVSGFTPNNRSLFNDIEGVDSSNPNALVKTLRLVGVQAAALESRGVLADEITDARVENVHLSGSVTVANPRVGGLSDLATNAVVVDSSSDLVISSTNSSFDRSTVGGLLGRMAGTSQVLSSWTTGTFTGINSDSGGLVGQMTSSTTLISRSWSSVTITASGGRIGGLVGEADGEIRFSYATGDVTSSGSDEIGGLVGDMDNNASVVRDSFSAGQVSFGGLNGRAGGLVGNLQAFNRVVERSLSTSAPQGSGVSANTGAFAGNQGLTDSDFNTITNPSLADLTNLNDNFFDNSSSGSLLGVANTIDLDDPDAQERVTGLPTTQLQSFATFDEGNWAIVDGWAPFSAPDSGSVVKGTHQVWGICSGSGYPFLLWQFDADPCVTGASAPAVTPERRADDAGIHLDFQASIGDLLAGSSVVIGGQGLVGGSQYSLVVRSTPQTLDSGSASALGNFSKRVFMPSLAAGSHTLTLSATAADGSVLTLVQGFTVGSDGRVTAVGSTTGTQTGGLAVTGVSGIHSSTAWAVLVALVGLFLLSVSRRRVGPGRL